MPLTNQTVVVFGGTGRQGGSVAAELGRAFPEATIRLVSREAPDSEKAQGALKQMPNGGKNYTVVQADMDKADEKLTAACGDAYGAFLVGAFWPATADGGAGANSPLDATVEMQAYRNVLGALKIGGVKHLVFSALEDTSLAKDFNADGRFKPLDATNGFVVPHFDGKGKIMAELNAQTDMMVDFLFVGFYYENWFGMKPNKGEDGSYALYLPLDGKPHYMVCVSDVGKTVAPLFARNPVFGDGKIAGTVEQSWPITCSVGCKMTGPEIAEAFSKVCLKGSKVGFVDVPVEPWIQSGIAAGMPELVANDFGNMFGYFQTKTYIDVRDEGMAGAGKMTPFESWLGMVQGALYPDLETKAAPPAKEGACCSVQ